MIDSYAIDNVWKKLQYKYKFIYFKYLFANQLTTRSDIKKNTYSHDNQYDLKDEVILNE